MCFCRGLQPVDFANNVDRAKLPFEQHASFKLCFGPWLFCHLFDLWDVAGSWARLESCAALQGGKRNTLHRLAYLQIQVITHGVHSHVVESHGWRSFPWTCVLSLWRRSPEVFYAKSK